jgi:hypothetical protein
MRHRPDSGQERRVLKAMRILMAAIVGFIALLAAPLGVRAGEPSPVWKDGWTINIPGQSSWVSDGTPSPFYLQSTPSTPYVPGSVKNPYGFADYSIGRTLGVGQELGLGNMQATLGVRMAEPLASNGFTPSFDPRRYLGVGPRLGLEGNRPLQSSWVVEWKVGAALLNGKSHVRHRRVASSTRRCRISPTAVRSSMSMDCSACRTGSTVRQS